MNPKTLLKVAGIALIIHGVIELFGLFSFFTGEPPNFIFQEIKTNWQQAVVVGVIAGAVRIVAAVGIFRIMRWGVVLGMAQSVITLATLTFYLPFGVMDALLSSIALVALVMAWLGRVRGGLGMTVAVMGAVLGAVTGSSIAAAAMMTKIAFPEMLKHKYDPAVAAGVIAGASPLVLIIPPSIFLLFYAIMTYEDAGKVLLAGFIPGFLAAGVYLVIIYFLALRSPEKWPPVARTFTFRERMRASRGIGPVFLMIVLTLGGIYGGIFTPSEGGAAGAFIALIFLLFMKRGKSWRLIVSSVWEAASTTSMVFFIVIGALLYGRFFSFTGAGEKMISALANIPVSPYIILTLIVLLYLVLGCFIDGISMFAITLPVAHPLIIKLGFDPIWFGVVATILVGVGALTPPFGIVVFTVKSLVGKQVDLMPIFMNAMPYAAAMLILIVLMTIWPQIALFLPSHMGK